MTYAATILADTPILYYRFGEASGSVATDASGNGRNGVYANTPSFAQTGFVSGDADTSIKFNYRAPAADNTLLADQMRVPYTSADLVSAVSVEFLIKGTLWHSPSQIVAARSDSWYMSILGTVSDSWVAKRPTFQVNSGIPGDGQINVISSVTINDGAIHHVVGTADATTIKIYVDGQLAGTTTRTSGASIPPSFNMQTTVNGFSPGDSTSIGDLQIDELAIYNYALTSQRIAAHKAAAGAIIWISETDVRTGTEGTSTVSQGRTSSDSAVLGNTASIAATVTATEARTVTVTNIVTITKTSADAFTGTDTASTPGPTVSDVATATESQSVVNQVVNQPLGFTQLTNFPGGVFREDPVAFDGDNLIYAIAGFAGTGALWVYDLTTLLWASVSVAPHPHHNGAMVYLDGLLYCFGGHDFSVGGDEVALDIYEIATDTWSVGADMPAINSGGGATRGVAVGTEIYLAIHQSDPIDFLRYTPSTDSYAALASGTTEGLEGFGELAYGGDGSTLWWVNGWYSSSTPPGTVLKYSIASDQWTMMAGVDPFPSEQQFAGFVGDKIVVIGGDNAPSSAAINGVRYYDPTTDTWEVLSVTLSPPLSDLSGAIVGTKAYLVGGYDNTFVATTKWQVIDLATVDNADPKVDFATFSEAESVVPTTFLGGGGGIGVGTGLNAKWSFIDPKGVLADYYFEINPNKMSDPIRKKNTTSLGKAPNGVQRVWRNNNKAPREWTFSGVTRTKEQQDSFKTWYDLKQKIWLRDHLGRVWEIRLMKFAPEPRRPTATNQYRYTYTFTANVYRKVAG